MPERIPIAIVSGFLGSGKTTLVQHLLADARATGLRVAVVSNELGELGVDRALLARGDDDDDRPPHRAFLQDQLEVDVVHRLQIPAAAA
ncbi:MAG: GTP-binding protein, partial [Myxococcota bacterium]